MRRLPLLRYHIPALMGGLDGSRTHVQMLVRTPSSSCEENNHVYIIPRKFCFWLHPVLKVFKIFRGHELTVEGNVTRVDGYVRYFLPVVPAARLVDVRVQIHVNYLILPFFIGLIALPRHHAYVYFIRVRPSSRVETLSGEYISECIGDEMADAAEAYFKIPVYFIGSIPLVVLFLSDRSELRT